MQQLDFSPFQPLNGSLPYRLVAVHPTEPLVALQALLDGHTFDTPALSRTNVRCAIWHRETYEIVSKPEGAVALAWNAEGTEMGMVREYYRRPSLHDSTAQSIFSYTWERYSWPSQERISSCSLSFDSDWPEFVAFSPAGDLAVVQWFEAEKAGLHLLSLNKDGDELLDDADLPLIEHEDEDDLSPSVDLSWIGLSPSAKPPWLRHKVNPFPSAEEEEEEDTRFFVDTNLATPPVFSPNGRFLIFCWQPSQRWWTDVPDDRYVEGELPARTGTCHVGYVQILDGKTSTTHRIALSVDLPPGWQPSYEGDRSNELLEDPVFLDHQHFQLRLPDGKTNRYSVLE